MLYYIIRSPLPCLALTVGLSATQAQADGIRVVADIPPVQSLVAQVLGDHGSVSLIMRPGSDPHHYAMRPSEASSLEAADLVVWIGPDLTPWLEGPVETLAADAEHLALLDADGTHRLPYREKFEAAGHGDHDEHGDEQHGHDDHGHDDHAKEKHGHDDHGHNHGDTDAHAWLDPENGRVWLDLIAAQLSEIEPGAAAEFRRNAQIGKVRIKAAAAQADALIAPVRDRSFVVYHDAFQYFEDAYGLTLAGAISLGDAAGPGPAHVAEVRETVRSMNVSCLLAEPGYNDGLVAAVLEGTGAKTVVLDQLGASLEPGPALYPTLLKTLAQDFAGCE